MATGNIGKPFLRDIQLPLDQRSDPIPHHGSEDADLAVIGLAQAPVPLACDTGRHVALFDEGALVDDQRAGVSEMGVGIGNQLPAHATAAPGRFAQHVVELLVMAARYSLGHLLRVAPTTLEQTMQIEACGVFNGSGTALEASKVRREAGIEVSECGSNQFCNAIRVFELTL